MTEAPATTSPPLDEIMLAMDVVDTLRHRQRIVDRELAADERDQELIARLREIYAGQGIAVSDRIIEQGVRDLRADRFSYTPPAPSLGRTLARAYVSRGRWGKPVIGLAGVLAVVLVAYQLLVRGPALDAIAALPGDLDRSYSAVVDLAEQPAVDARAEAVRSDAEAALRSGDHDGARASIDELEALLATLQLQYEIRVRSEPGELSGVWRIPDANPDAQNFYLVVEAIDRNGDAIRLPIVNEENGTTYRVTHWGQRVDEDTFRELAADKADDGIIQRSRLGEKRRGVLEPDYRSGVLQGAITDW